MIEQFSLQTQNYHLCCKATNTIIGFQVRSNLNAIEIYQAQFTYDALPQTLKYIVNDTQVLFKYLKNYKSERLNFVIHKNQQTSIIEPKMIINMVLGEEIVNKIHLPLKLIEITNQIKYRIESQTLLNNFNKSKQQNEQLKIKIDEIQLKNLKLTQDLQKMLQKYNKIEEELKSKYNIIEELSIKIRQRQKIIDRLTQSFQIVPFLRTETDRIQDQNRRNKNQLNKLDGYLQMKKQNENIQGFYVRKGKKKVKTQEQEQQQMQQLKNEKKQNPFGYMMETQLQEQQ